MMCRFLFTAGLNNKLIRLINFNFFFLIYILSAGIGRTGTFIAINFLFEQVRNNEKINIKNTVQFLRSQRVSLVQTWVHQIFK